MNMFFAANECLLKDIDMIWPNGNCVGGRACGEAPKDWKRDDPNDCFNLCRNTPTCTHFVWISPEHEWQAGRNLCLLKYGRFETKEGKGLTSGFFSSSCGN